MDGISGGDTRFGGNGGRKRAAAGSVEPHLGEARCKEHADYAMRVLLPDGAKNSGDVIGEILKTYKTIAVVGLSGNPERPSFGVTEYMQKAGYKIVPVNPNEREVLGEKSYARLEDVPGKIEIVDIFRRAEDVPPVVDSAIQTGAKVIWMQMGIENAAAAEKARAAGLIVVEDACILVEHRKRLRANSL
jgi:predicted CoA-binding protein